MATRGHKREGPRRSLGGTEREARRVHRDNHLDWRYSTLFLLQLDGRVGAGGADSLPKDREDGDEGCEQTCHREDPPMETDAVGIAVQPSVHQVPRHRDGDDERHTDHLHELGHKAPQNRVIVSAIDLLERHCPAFLLHIVRTHRHETQSRDKQ